jgi:rhodanese-related sulfurtransferase
MQEVSMKQTKKMQLSWIMVALLACMSFITVSCQPKVDEFEKLRSHIDEALQTMTATKSVTDVKQIVDDPTEAAKNTIISVRSAEHYAKGHVPGAINIPYKDIAKLENLKKLSKDKTIITYCYTGHTGQVACTVLNLLGYNAVNMKYGMMGWTDNADVLNTTPFNCAPPNYPVNTGTEP